MLRTTELKKKNLHTTDLMRTATLKCVFALKNIMDTLSIIYMTEFGVAFFGSNWQVFGTDLL